MELFRDISIQFLLLLIRGIPLVVVVILLVAAINERIRRIVLWIMAPLAGLSLIAYFILAPRNLTGASDWANLMGGLKDGLVAAIPYLAGLVFFGILAYLIGPFLYEATLGAIDRRTRTAYLEGMIEHLTEQTANTLPIAAQQAVLESLRNTRAISLRIVGETATGKSHLLHLAALELARKALADEYEPLPLLVDLDVLLALEPDIDHHAGPFTRPRSLSGLQTMRLPFSERMLRLHARKRKLVFLVDGSVHTFSRAFLSALAQTNLLNDLDGLVQYFPACPFLIALPPGVHHPLLESHIPQMVELHPLDDLEIRQLLTFATVPSSGSAWAGLARRVLILKHLITYAKFRGLGLPPDLRELFRTVSYPANVPPDRVETALAQLAREIQRSRRYALPRQLASGLVRAAGERRQDGVSLSGLVRSGMLRRIDLAEEAGGEASLIAFAHPLYLAYAIALSWYSADGQTLVPAAEAYAEDPLLALALMFFTNIETDPLHFSRALEGLARQEEGLHLVRRCLLAMPAASRPPALLMPALVQLIRGLPKDSTVLDQARPLLAGLDDRARTQLYIQALAGMDERGQEVTLKQINLNDIQAGHPLEELRGLLWYGPDEMSETVANVWADEDPHEALALLREMYEEGPEPKRALALRLFILLPRERAEEYLYSRLRGEKEPTRRIELLRELVEIGASMTLPLLERVADPAEDALVRIYAAQSLAERPSLEMQTESVLRELVRVSRAPMPEPARGCIHELLENLRERTPESVSRWEALANPYTPGRPVNNPEMFFGREALLHELRVGVENGTHMLLHGEPRIGKTSLLRMLEMKLQEEAARGAPVRSTFLDLQGLRENEFYETLVRAIIEQLRDPELVADSEIERPYTDTAFERDLAGLMEYLRGKHGERVRLAVLLDEADTLSSYALPMQSALRRILRAKEMNGLTLVLAGSPAVQEWQRPPSPLAGLFALRPVTRLSAESAARLITRPVAEAFTYQPAALTAVQRATTGRPYDIHALCQKLVNGMLSGSGQVITEEMVNQALQNSMGGRGNLLANADSVLAALIDWVESHPQANNAQVQERIQSAWQELLPLMINQVAQVRKGAK